MRTTISLDDYLLDGAKRRARARGQTLGELIEEAIRRELAEQPPASPTEIPVFEAEGGLLPGIDPDSNRALRKALDDGHGVDELR